MKNLHKITPSTLVVYRQIKRQKEIAFKYPVVINILCDIISDVVDVNMKTRPLTS